MKKISMILVAFAMVLGLAQCKKNEATDQNETVTITLDVKHNNSAKVDVNPTIGTVDFETGDKVYVGSGGKYVGFLTHNGTNFVGNITNPTEGQPLQFYFLGNVTPQETLSAGTMEECSVIISDQTEHLPVISCAPSFENYESGVTAYTGHLLNKCALVKFNVTTPSNSPICITGMKNKMTVDFSQNTVTSSIDGDGVIMLPAGAGENVEKWAILLPQEALEEGEEGSAYTENGAYSGTRGAVPTIGENGYLDNGIDVNVVSIASTEHEYVDLGLPSGTLWATCNVGANAPEEYGDYFAWGETQPKDYYDWSTYQYCNGSQNTLTKYCNVSSYGYNNFTDELTTLLPEDDAATTNWGSAWRMPTKGEWQELYNNTTVTWTVQDDVYGCLFTALNGNSIFLPAAGCRVESNLNYAANNGFYWSSSMGILIPNRAYHLYFYSDDYILATRRYAGLSIRPVLSAPQSNTPIGAINGLFTINANGDQVYFSQGNLQYQASTNTWRFAENQWDYVGTQSPSYGMPGGTISGSDNNRISSTYSGWIDLFGWGTSGWNSGNTYYHPWDYEQPQDHWEQGYGYGPTDGTNYDFDLTGSYANSDWGVYVPIINGGNTNNTWRTLMLSEWDYVFNTRVTTSGYRYAKTQINGVNGVILLPDNWDPSIFTINNLNEGEASFNSNVINQSQWSTLENSGAVFLPAAGGRSGITAFNVGTFGGYWSATSCSYGSAYFVCFLDTSPYFYLPGNYRYYGRSVRLVQDHNR